jgi:hypothetical protein
MSFILVVGTVLTMAARQYIQRHHQWERAQHRVVVVVTADFSLQALELLWKHQDLAPSMVYLVASENQTQSSINHLQPLLQDNKVVLITPEYNYGPFLTTIIAGLEMESYDTRVICMFDSQLLLAYRPNLVSSLLQASIRRDLVALALEGTSIDKLVDQTKRSSVSNNVHHRSNAQVDVLSGPVVVLQRRLVDIESLHQLALSFSPELRQQAGLMILSAHLEQRGVSRRLVRSKGYIPVQRHAQSEVEAFHLLQQRLGIWKNIKSSSVL